MKQYIAAIDQGTTSSRCIIFDHDGQIISIDQQEHKQIFPQSGWVEHNPIEIWQRVREVVENALLKANLTNKNIAAVGITNQRETTLIWNRKTGVVYHNAIVWQDTRSNKLCNQLAKGYGLDRFREKCGLPLNPYFSGTKIKWLLENIDGLREAAESGEAIFGTIDTWLIWKLTGGVNSGKHVTDVTNASRTMLMNLKTLNWDPEILEIFEIPRKMMPEIKSSSGFFGTVTDPILKGVPVAGVLGDQQAALFGQTCFDVGEAKNTYGTGCFMLLNTGNQIIPSESGLLTTLGYKIGNHPAVYCLEGSIAIAGSLVQWIRDNMKMIESSNEIEELANSVSDNGGIYFVPAFSGLFAPHWRADARGVIVGLTGYVNRGHLARAVVESTAFQTLEVIEAMEKDSKVKLTTLKVDGGMTVNETLMQFQADLLNVPVVRPIVKETTALGAAYAAGLAVGYWKDLNQLRLNWGQDKVWQPEMESEKRNHLYAEWKKAVSRTLNWVE
ncbi:MAG: glycerol kinase GlpK [Anaerolineaceae bacterium]|nr:glycerol kinase GlpK [Anaerolineaceae bacterium]